MAAQTPPPSADTSVPFTFFVSLVENIGNIKPRKASEKASCSAPSGAPAAQTFGRWIAALHRQHSTIPHGVTAAVFRMLFPEDDPRRKYNLQEKVLAKSVAKVLGVSTAPGARGESLAKWNGEDAQGFLGAEIKHIIEKGSPPAPSSISIVEVDALLTELACTCPFSAPATRASHGARPRDRTSILRALYARLSPAEAAVVTQIILKDMRPLLYPNAAEARHYSSALLEYNSNAVTPLRRDDAMRKWDPSGRMLRAYRVRGFFEEASLAFECKTDEEAQQYLVPRVGCLIQIPKCTKGQGCAQSLKLLTNSRMVWAETKYDGERTQIHVELDPARPASPKITIYSKSGRESTLDRFAVHSIICDALGLSGNSAASIISKCMVKRNIILEAEMVAFSDTLGRIDEFWRIRSLIASTAIGVRHKTPPRPADTQTEENCDSQCSMISNASDGGTRHLALVFFDILLLDDTSLLARSYGERRALLEEVVTPIPGFSMLAERRPVPMVDRTSGRSLADPAAVLRRAFADAIAGFEEGLVLKAEEARYDDWNSPWIKLKKDYIPGYGDAVDLVLVGATWEKDRARELRVPTSTYTTFYIGALANGEELKKNPRRRPHFEVFFTASYGLSREQLEELNFMIRSSDPVEYSPERRPSDLPYTLDIFKGLKPPSVLLRTLILAEITSATFTKAEHGKFYESRFPRITKTFRPSERTWADGMTLDELQKIARNSVGRDRTDKDVEDWAAALFGQPASPGVRSAVKRKRTAEMWVERMEDVDRKVGGKRRRTGGTRKEGPVSLDDGCAEADKRLGPVLPLRAGARSSGAPRLRALGSVTNIARAELIQEAAATSVPSSMVLFHGSVARSSASPVVTLPKTPTRTVGSNDADHIKQEAAEPNMLRTPVSIGRRTPEEPKNNSKREMTLALRAEPKPIPAISNPTFRAKTSQSGIDVCMEDKAEDLTSTPMGVFLQNAFVWLAKPHGSSRPPWRAPSRVVIPAGQQVSTLDALLRACAWCNTSQPVCKWVERGVIFVDDRDGPADKALPWIEYPIKTLLERRAALTSGNEHANCRPIWVFSMKAMSFDELRNFAGNVEEQALCRIG
ncbi:hypothetical protein CERSUDRAFT_122630 [Gelatoporia subvermispora B]|uniref:ATP-dependent DNA ligase family profile domain-containing protein n=1 Tax=Ceriporiopsis subvermispora (strain B) TaxID=914234 RepID=M2PRG2_CERS8|nr:hypothetical protein CERSUDRAFT_122630 [Gelatoporia subvermispora B]